MGLDASLSSELIRTIRQWVTVAIVAGAAILGWRFYLQSQSLPGPSPTPPPEQRLTALTDALRTSKPERVQRLAELWAGLADLVPSQAKSLLAVQRINQLAGSIAVSGLDERNPAASAIVGAEFANLKNRVTDPLDDEERKLVSEYFRALSKAAQEAL
jgi:hypothetical protein